MVPKFDSNSQTGNPIQAPPSPTSLSCLGGRTSLPKVKSGSNSQTGNPIRAPSSTTSLSCLGGRVCQVSCSTDASLHLVRAGVQMHGDQAPVVHYREHLYRHMLPYTLSYKIVSILALPTWTTDHRTFNPIGVGKHKEFINPINRERESIPEVAVAVEAPPLALRRSSSPHHRTTASPSPFVARRSSLDTDRMAAFERALITWGGWVDTNTDPIKTMVFFQGISPSHYFGSDWNEPKANKCLGQTAPPVAGSTYAGKYPPAVEGVKRAIRKIKNPVILLDITTLSLLRKDGHPSIYGNGGTNGVDCTHWCVARVPDTWNQILYNIVSQKNQRWRVIGGLWRKLRGDYRVISGRRKWWLTLGVVGGGGGWKPNRWKLKVRREEEDG
ncbi:hypothetical protein ACSBR2_011819 [Camellia fascicularis]